MLGTNIFALQTNTGEHDEENDQDELDQVAELPATMEKLVDNFRYYGNLSNASIATAMIELLRQGRLHEGQWMALPAVGGGMNYGCWLLRFHELYNLDAVLNPA